MNDPTMAPNKCLVRLDETHECELVAGHSGPHFAFVRTIAKEWWDRGVRTRVVMGSALPADAANATCPLCFERVFLPEHERYLRLREAAVALADAVEATSAYLVQPVRRRQEELRKELEGC